MAEFDQSSYALTPGNDTIMIVLQLLASLPVVLIILDARNAFCHWRELKRRRGPDFASPCDGIVLEQDALDLHTSGGGVVCPRAGAFGSFIVAAIASMNPT